MTLVQDCCAAKVSYRAAKTLSKFLHEVLHSPQCTMCDKVQVRVSTHKEAYHRENNIKLQTIFIKNQNLKKFRYSAGIFCEVYKLILYQSTLLVFTSWVEIWLLPLSLLTVSSLFDGHSDCIRLNKPTDLQSINQSTNQSINQSMNQSMNEWINQSINQSLRVRSIDPIPE